jgi:hypothetical protein
MARLLFKLSQVPADEAQDIRDLLDANDIRYYETDAGFFRVGLDAIWLSDTAQEIQARELIRHYQEARTAQQQASYAQLAEAGQAPTLWQNFCAQPVRFLLLVCAIIFVAGITLVPFLMLLKTA